MRLSTVTSAPIARGELDRHVAETAEPDDADRLPGPTFQVPQRRIGGDAGAEQWRRRAAGSRLSGTRSDELLAHDHDAWNSRHKWARR